MSLTRDRRGVALILTLGILSLMIVLCLSFAMSALSSNSSAQFAVDLVRARQFAESGLQRTIASLKTDLIDTSDYNNYYPGSKIMLQGSGNWADYTYMISLINPAAGEVQMTDGLLDAVTHSVDGLDYIPNAAPTAVTSSGSNVNLSAVYSWLPIHQTRSMGGNQVTVLAGRYGYILIDETGKLDPNSTVDTTYSEGSEFDGDSDDTDDYNKGFFMSELNLRDVGFASAFAAKLRPSSAGGLMPSNAKWYSRYHIARVTSLATDSNGQDTLDLMNRTLFPYRRPDTISNQMEMTSDGYTVTYDLSAAGPMASAGNGNNKSSLQNYIINARTSTPKHPGIPWLQNWNDIGTYQTTGDRFDSKEAHALNIAANIKDYCDTDYDSSRDTEGMSYGNGTPTFWGNEKVPYLSRLMVTVRNDTYTSGSGSTRTVRPYLRYYIRPELVNNFGDLTSYATRCRIDITGSLNYKSLNLDGSFSEYTPTFSMNFNPFDVANPDSTNDEKNISGDFSANGFIQLGATVKSGRLQHGKDNVSGQSAYEIGTVDSAPYLQLYDVKLQITRIRVMEYGGSSYRWDYAMPLDSDQWTDPIATLPATNDGTDEQYFLFAAPNPMNNLFPGDWNVTGPLTSDPFADSTLDPPDFWDTPATRIFIRNGEMKHLVELGAIYRMDPRKAGDPLASYHTLNLIDYKYNGDVQVPGEYADSTDGVVDNYDGDLLDTEGNGGDRNILDQVRLGSENAAGRDLIGRININTRRSEVLKALFKRVPSAGFTGGDDISTSQVNSLVTHILDKTKIVANQTPKANGPLPIGLFENNRNPALYGLLFQPADLTSSGLDEDQLEHLIAQTQQLVNGKHNYFTCVVAAQVLKDIGGVMPENDPSAVEADYEIDVNGKKALLGRYDEGTDLILAEQKIRVVLYRSAVTNKISVERFDYLDE